VPQVLMVASEAAPFAKSGGLGDVLGSLPPALARAGVDVAVALPRYGFIPAAGLQRVRENLWIPLGPNTWPVEIYAAVEGGVPFFLIDCPPLYGRPGLYGEHGTDYPDNHIRFGLLCRAALEVVRHLFRPRVLHCHDWQAALIPAWLRYPLALDPTFLGIRTALTIHNLGYQGRFGREAMPETGLDESTVPVDVVTHRGDLNFLKAGIELADALTTVSPTYAREIQTPEFGCGLDELLRRRSADLTGILNGVDYSRWSPETDPYIATNYSAEDLSGKRDCKADLLAEFGLPAAAIDTPLIGVVSRFTSQKGFDLVAEAAAELASLDLLLAALGTGEPRYEKMFRELQQSYPGKVAVRIAYDEALAHKIEAGADMFLMPSRYEPCGLNQIYSLRYGTIPIVRLTGGLADTVEDGETGFGFHDYSAAALLEAVRRALEVWRDPRRWRRMMFRAMKKDFSWAASARRYAALYERLLEDSIGAAGELTSPAGVVENDR